MYLSPPQLRHNLANCCLATALADRKALARFYASNKIVALINIYWLCN